MVRTEQLRKSFQVAKEEFESQNRLLLLELPQFYEKRVDYFQPCLQVILASTLKAAMAPGTERVTELLIENDLILQALIRSQVDYFGETTRLFTHLVSANPEAANLKADERHREELKQIMTDIKSLSIVEN